jgi:hypothetical protein
MTPVKDVTGTAATIDNVAFTNASYGAAPTIASDMSRFNGVPFSSMTWR